MLRIIGGTKKTLFKLAVFEALIISVSGAFAGILFSGLIVFLFTQAIIMGMKMPFLTPSAFWTLVYGVSAFAAISIIGPVSVLKTMYGITKKEPALLQG